MLRDRCETRPCRWSVRGLAAVDELVAAARSDGEDADDARAALSLLLRLVDRGIA